MANMNYLETESRIIDALRSVYDPEIPVNIYDLGLIYEIKLSGQGDVYIKMTLTSPNCPIAEDMPINVRDAVASVEGIQKVDVELTFEPEWTKEMMSDAAKLELGFF
ncbi:MAG: SUF system Fe-S cluster assembly protein [Bacteroidales bacterium]|nr:SUF system Fe-S cluster assembly protein [Bacteroidales bacterium]